MRKEVRNFIQYRLGAQLLLFLGGGLFYWYYPSLYAGYALYSTRFVFFSLLFSFGIGAVSQVVLIQKKSSIEVVLSFLIWLFLAVSLLNFILLCCKFDFYSDYTYIFWPFGILSHGILGIYLGRKEDKEYNAFTVRSALVAVIGFLFSAASKSIEVFFVLTSLNTLITVITFCSRMRWVIRKPKLLPFGLVKSEMLAFYSSMIGFKNAPMVLSYVISAELFSLFKVINSVISAGASTIIAYAQRQYLDSQERVNQARPEKYLKNSNLAKSDYLLFSCFVGTLLLIGLFYSYDAVILGFVSFTMVIVNVSNTMSYNLLRSKERFSTDIFTAVFLCISYWTLSKHLYTVFGTTLIINILYSFILFKNLRYAKTF